MDSYLILYAIIIFFFFLSGYAKTRRKIILLEIIALLLSSFYFILIDRIFVVLMDILFIMINVISLRLTEDKEKNKRLQKIMFILSIPIIALSFHAFKDNIDFIVVAIAACGVIAKFSPKVSHTRFFLLLSNIGWISYFMMLGKNVEAFLNVPSAVIFLFRLVEGLGEKKETIKVEVIEVDKIEIKE